MRLTICKLCNGGGGRRGHKGDRLLECDMFGVIQGTKGIFPSWGEEFFYLKGGRGDIAQNPAISSLSEHTFK